MALFRGCGRAERVRALFARRQSGRTSSVQAKHARSGKRHWTALLGNGGVRTRWAYRKPLINLDCPRRLFADGRFVRLKPRPSAKVSNYFCGAGDLRARFASAAVTKEVPNGYSADSNEALMFGSASASMMERSSLPIRRGNGRAASSTRWMASGLALPSDPLELEGIASDGCPAWPGLHLGPAQCHAPCPQPLRAGGSRVCAGHLRLLLGAPAAIPEVSPRTAGVARLRRGDPAGLAGRRCRAALLARWPRHPAAGNRGHHLHSGFRHLPLAPDPQRSAPGRRTIRLAGNRPQEPSPPDPELLHSAGGVDEQTLRPRR